MQLSGVTPAMGLAASERESERTIGCRGNKKQVLANKDASPFLCCFVVVVMVVVGAVVGMHLNITFVHFLMAK